MLIFLFTKKKIDDIFVNVAMIVTSSTVPGKSIDIKMNS